MLPSVCDFSFFVLYPSYPHKCKSLPAWNLFHKLQTKNVHNSFVWQNPAEEDNVLK